MATLTVVNNTGSDVVIGDVGVLVPGSGSDTYQDPVTIRDLALSRDLRSLVDAGTLSLTDGTNPITVEDLLEYFESGGFQFPFAPAVSSNARFWLIQQDAGLTSLSQVGFSTAPTVNGTPSVQNLQTAQFVRYTSAAAGSALAGLLSSAFTQTRLNFRPSYKAIVRTGPSVTEVRYWIGLFASDPMGSSDPAIDGMGFRYDTGVDGTAFWRAWSNSGAGSEVTATSVAVTADTTYVFTIEISHDGSEIFFFINDLLVASHSSSIPGGAVDLGHVESLITLSSGARSLSFGKLGVLQRDR